MLRSQSQTMLWNNPISANTNYIYIYSYIYIYIYRYMKTKVCELSSDKPFRMVLSMLLTTINICLWASCIYIYICMYIHTNIQLIGSIVHTYKHTVKRKWQLQKDVDDSNSIISREREGELKRVSYLSLKWKYFDPTNILPF